MAQTEQIASSPRLSHHQLPPSPISDDEDDIPDVVITASVDSPNGLTITNNETNITNGKKLQTSPDEEVIKSRGRKKGAGLRTMWMVCPEAMATRKSPRKAARSTDFVSYFFRSPSPKKTPVKCYRLTPTKASCKLRSTSFRKRLALSGGDTTTHKKSHARRST